MGNPHSIHIAMLGLDGAGKTTALYRLKLNEYTNTLPTVGFNCEKIKGQFGKSKGVTFTVWDVGGQEKLRPLWKSYTRSADAMIFVVDSQDLEALEEAKVELQRLARMPESGGMPILVYANKQDLPGALHRLEVETLMNLRDLPDGRCETQEVCAVTGEGLFEGLDILYEMYMKRKKAAKKSHKK